MSAEFHTLPQNVVEVQGKTITIGWAPVDYRRANIGDMVSQEDLNKIFWQQLGVFSRVEDARNFITAYLDTYLSQDSSSNVYAKRTSMNFEKGKTDLFFGPAVDSDQQLPALARNQIGVWLRTYGQSGHYKREDLFLDTPDVVNMSLGKIRQTTEEL